MNKLDIFLSYTYKAEEYALKLSCMLVAGGSTTCLNKDRCRKSGNFTVMYERIDRCTHFVLLTDRNIFGPENFRNHLELAYAIARNKRIIPVMVPGFEGVSNNMADEVSPVRNYHCIFFDKDNPEKSYSDIINMINNYHDVPETIDNGRSETVFYENGDRYFGEMKDGMRNGYGSMYYYMGGHYEGYWKDDKREGSGCSQDFMGYRYDGGWKNDMYDGYGVLMTSNSLYKGDFLNGEPSGRGCLYRSDGTRITGSFCGSFNGTGICYDNNGERYEGEIREESRNGKGVCYYTDGTRFDGLWKDGRKHGPGTFYHADGTSEHQEWFEGKLKRF